MTKYVKVSITTQYNIIRDVKPYRDRRSQHVTLVAFITISIQIQCIDCCFTMSWIPCFHLLTYDIYSLTDGVIKFSCCQPAVPGGWRQHKYMPWVAQTLTSQAHYYACAACLLSFSPLKQATTTAAVAPRPINLVQGTSYSIQKITRCKKPSHRRCQFHLMQNPNLHDACSHNWINSQHSGIVWYGKV